MIRTQTEALTTVERASILLVTTIEDRSMASELGLAVQTLYKRGEEWFAPMKRAGRSRTKRFAPVEREMLDPLERAKRHLSQQIGSFDMAQERRRRDEETKLREEAAIRN